MKKDTELRNEAYAKMSPTEKRVAIAKDTLAIVKVGGVNVSTGHYVGLCDEDVKIPESGSMREFLMQNAQALPECKVCAKGGLFLGKVLGYNQVEIESCGVGHSDNNYVNGVWVTSGIEMSDPSQQLLDAFDKETLDDIESAFEREQYGLACDKAEFMYRDINDPVIRLTKICENIIRNKGEFKIELTGENLVSYEEIYD